MVYPGHTLTEDVGSDEDLPDLVLAEARCGTVDFDRLSQAGIGLDEALDAYSGDFEEFCTMADGFGITDELQDALESYARGIVVLDRVTVPELLRGRRFGLLLSSLVLRELGWQRLAVAMPAAFEVEPRSPARPSADERNVRLWTEFGFQRYRNEGIYFLDTGLNTLDNNVRRYRSAVDDGAPIVVL